MDYFSDERNLIRKVKKIVSSFFGFLLCASSSFRLPMQEQISISGLKALVSSEDEIKEDRVVNRSAGLGIVRSKLLLNHSSSSPYSHFCNSIRSSNLLMDDLIGTESGFCLLTSNTDEIELKLTPSDSHFATNQQNQRCAPPKKQFPPPIPFLAAQPGTRTRPPWILTRNCSDGRLILRLERVRHHQSLESHRENGRLILNLIPSVGGSDSEDDDDRDLQFIEEEEEMESIECEEDHPKIAFKSFTYGGDGGGGMLFCGVNGNYEERHVVHHGHFGSAPLRPMGTVM